MINVIDEYFFSYLPMVKKEKNIMKQIILSMYKVNMRIRRKRDLSIFHKINLLLL